MNNDINEGAERKDAYGDPETPETKGVPGASFEEDAHIAPAEAAADTRATGSFAPQGVGAYSEAPGASGQAAPQTPPQTPPAQGASEPRPDGSYSMPHPANGTTYFRPAQGDPGQRAEWSNGGTSYGAQAPYAPPVRPAYGAPQSGQWQGGYGAYPGQGHAQGYGYPYGQQGTQPSGQRGEKKAKKGATIAVVAVICAVCVLLSGAAGFLGARAANVKSISSGVESKEVNSSNNSGSVSESGNTTVLYRSVSTDSEAKSEATVTDVVDAVANSVVEITTEFRSTGYWQYVQSGAGSGVIISEDGYILTNNHVIENNDSIADTINVRLRDGSVYLAKVIGRDTDEDIAVIKVEASGLTAAVFGDSSKLVVGEDIVAIGNPLGELGGTVTEGIISALDREVDVEGTMMTLLQISAAINPGNSGGGLFNMKGELVGVVNAKSSGSGIEGLGFAIPSNNASHIAEELIAHGYVTGKPYIGISTYYASDAYTAYRYFGSQATGLYIYETVKGYNDGVLQKNDRIVEVDGVEIATNDDLSKAIKNAEIGSTLKFVVYRGGRRTEVDVTVYEYVPSDVEFKP